MCLPVVYSYQQETQTNTYPHVSRCWSVSLVGINCLIPNFSMPYNVLNCFKSILLICSCNSNSLCNGSVLFLVGIRKTHVIVRAGEERKWGGDPCGRPRSLSILPATKLTITESGVETLAVALEACQYPKTTRILKNTVY